MAASGRPEERYLRRETSADFTPFSSLNRHTNKSAVRERRVVAPRVCRRAKQAWCIFIIAVVPRLDGARDEGAVAGTPRAYCEAPRTSGVGGEDTSAAGRAAAAAVAAGRAGASPRTNPVGRRGGGAPWVAVLPEIRHGLGAATLPGCFVRDAFFSDGGGDRDDAFFLRGPANPRGLRPGAAAAGAGAGAGSGGVGVGRRRRGRPRPPFEPPPCMRGA